MINLNKLKLTHWVSKDCVDLVLQGKGLLKDRFLKPKGFYLSVNGE